jgi:hypothetical protein
MKAKNDFVLNGLAIFLLCITPVICLYNSHNYPLISRAFIFFFLMSVLAALSLVWFCRFSLFRYLIFALGITVLIRFLAGSLLGPSLAVACLIVLILREKVSTVVVVSALVISLSSFVAIEKNYPHYVINNSEEPQMQGSNGRIPLIHIVFDEAAGIRSLSLAGKQGERSLNKLADVLTKHGFTSFRNAHSSSMWTRYSLGHMVNLKEVETVLGHKLSYYFEHNPLFELLNKKGYEINVIQSAYLDFCTSAIGYIRSCYEFPNSLSYLAENGLNQLNLVAPATLSELRLLHRLNPIMPKWAIFEKLGFHQRMPATLSSLAQQSVHSNFIARLEKDLSSSDQYYLVYFPYPHHYYYQDRDCRIKPLFDDWGDIGPWRNSSDEKRGLRIQDDERQVLYQDYFEQFECFTKVLDGLLDQVLNAHPDATMIIHGDHSSRISTRHIDDKSVEAFSYPDQQNFNDLYPTLFAVKYPGNVPGIIDCRISLVEFAQHFFQGQVGAMGEKTRIIADRLFPGSEACVGQLPTLSSLH